jgi:hypothetical protein
MGTGAVKYEPGGAQANAGVRAAAKPKKSPAAAGLSPEDRELIRAALEAREEWSETNANFEYVCDEMLVDYYTYKIKACEARYTYFLRLIKQKGLARYV